MTVECDILFHARFLSVCVSRHYTNGGGVALSYIHLDPLPAPSGERRAKGYVSRAAGRSPAYTCWMKCWRKFTLRTQKGFSRGSVSRRENNADASRQHHAV